MNLGERYWGCMLGQAVGDAMGSSLEFNYTGCFEPITEMIDGGPFSLNPGEWTIWLADLRPSYFFVTHGSFTIHFFYLVEGSTNYRGLHFHP